VSRLVQGELMLRYRWPRGGHVPSKRAPAAADPSFVINVRSRDDFRSYRFRQFVDVVVVVL